MAKGGALELCNEDGCARRRVGWGLCGLHYARMRRSGSAAPTHRSQARAETLSADGTRTCFKCGERKPFTLDHFYSDHRSPGELKGTCKECCRAAVRRSTLPLRYGIDESAYIALIDSQAGRCALCRVGLDGVSKVTTPHVDHCHATGKVRGILCHHCNVLLGHAKDSADLLQSAINYLRSANANA